MQKQAITDLNAPNGSRDISFQSQEFGQDGYRHFVGFQPHFQLNKTTACKISNKSNKRLMRYCTFIFPMSCNIASVMSYLSENEAKNLENGDIHITQIPNFEMEYLKNHWAH